MQEVVNGFDWDAGNSDKCRKHGLTLAEVESLFHGRLDVFPDVAHSHAEIRFFGIGRTSSGRHAFVAFTLRSKEGKRLIRPVSARYMHAREIQHYETQIAKS
jgi:uncharacterized DUF497 family protein